MEIIGIIIFCICVIAGFAGIFVPVLPDAPLIFAGVVLYWIFSGFEKVSVGMLIVQLCLMLIVILADFFAATYGVKRLGGSRLAQVLSIIGGIVGLLFQNIFGLIIGTMLGAIIGEFIDGGDIKKSIHIGFVSLLGFVGGVLFKVVMMVVMVGLLIMAILF